MKKIFALIALLLAVSGCSTTSHMGVVSAPGSNPEAMLGNANDYERVGPVSGRACRFFALGVFPWGDSTPGAAVNKALSDSEADAVIDASATTSLYGFLPIYQVLSYTCTTVRGTGVRVSGEGSAER